MRLLFGLALLVVALSFVSAPARAGECFGMLSYTYDGGECTDTTGDTTETLIRSGNESEALQRGMTDRSRSRMIAPARGGGMARASRGVDAKLYHQVAMRLRVVYDGPTILPPELAKKIAPHSAVQQKQLKRIFDADIFYFDHLPAATQNYLDVAFLPGVREFFIEALYRVYDGEEMPEDGTRGLLISAIINVGTQAPVTAYNEAAKERFREGYVINGMEFTVLDAYFRKHHLDRDEATLRRAARQELMSDLGFDPATMRLTDILCRSEPMRGFTCAQQRRLMLTGHL